MTDAEALELMNGFVAEMVPHQKALGIRVVSLSREPPFVVATLPWSEQIVGNPDTGVVHGGAITTLLDAASGASLYMRLLPSVTVATLDLRIDYFKPATPKADIFCKAEPLKITRNVGFVRSTAFHDGSDEPIATGTATFIITDRSRG